MTTEAHDFVTVKEKRCPRCGKTKPAEEFPKNRARADGLGSYCKSCSKILTAEWYAENKEAHIQATTARKAEVRKENRELLFAYLSARHCAICGEKNPLMLEFHTEPETLEADIANLVNDGAPWFRIEAILNEHATILCANDHRLASANARGLARAIKKWTSTPGVRRRRRR